MITTVGDTVSAWSGCVDQRRGEVLDPPVDGDVVDLDSTLGQEFLNIQPRTRSSMSTTGIPVTSAIVRDEPGMSTSVPPTSTSASVNTTVTLASRSRPSSRGHRRCHRAELYRVLHEDAPVAWGLRLFNGADEQQLTVMLPNPFLDDDQPLPIADWEQLACWDALRATYLDLAPDARDRTALRFHHG